MNRFLVGCGIVAVACGILVLSGIVYVIGINNSFARQESELIAKRDASKASLTSLMNELPTQGLSLEKYGDMFLKAIQASMTGRFGPNGAKAMLLALQEQNPSLSPEILLKMQRIITARYSGFEKDQKVTQDALGVYRGELGTHRGWIAKFFGYPKVDFADFEVVMAEDAAEAFKTHRFKPVDPFKKQ